MTRRTVAVELQLTVGKYIADAHRAEAATDDLKDEVRDLGVASTLTGAAMSRGVPHVKGLGDQARRTSADMSKLSEDIAETEKRIKALALEIGRTGHDKDLLRRFGAERSQLAQLVRARRLLAEMATDAASVASSAAKTGGNTFGGFASAFGPVGQTAIVAGIAGAVAAASPLIGAAITGAVTGGISAGAIAAGIAGAARDPAVKRAWAEVADEGEQVFTRFSAPLIEPTIAALGILRDALGDIGNDLVGIGRNAARLVVPLAEGVGDFVRELMPGIRTLVDDATPVFQVLRSELPMLGMAVRDFFESLAAGAEGGAEGLRSLLRITEFTLVSVGNMLEHLAKLWENIATVTRAAGDLAGPFGMLFEEPTITKVYRLGEAGERTFTSLGATAEDSISRIGDAAEKAKDELRKLNDAFDTTFGKLMDLDKAAIDFKLGLLEMRDAVKENGRTLAENTKEGLANRTMLLDMVGSANAMREAAIAQGDGTQQATDKANAAYDAQIAQIRAMAKSIGLPISQVDALINRYTTLALMPDLTKKFKLIVAVDDRAAQAIARATGQKIAFAKGGTTAAQHGLITDKPTILFGERETGREGFVPQRGISRDRALGLLGEMGAWHKASVVPWEAMRHTGAANNPTPVVLQITGSGGFTSWFHEQVRTGQIQLAVRGAGSVTVDR